LKLSQKMVPIISYLCVLTKKFFSGCVTYFLKLQKILKEGQRKEE